jgi:hypothetical protein
MLVVFGQAPAVVEDFETNYKEHLDDSQVKFGLGLILREGAVNVAIDHAGRVASERHVRYAPRDLDICKSAHPIRISQRVGQVAGPISRACQDVRIAEPDGAPVRASARHFVVEDPFKIVWTPKDCEPIVELISQTTPTSGIEIGQSLGTGEMLIRLLDHSSRAILTQEWVTIVPKPPGPPPRQASPVVHLSVSDPVIKAQLEGEDGHVRPLKLGENQVPDGTYDLAWSNSTRRQTWKIQPGGRYWADQELRPAPPLVQLMPPATPTASLAVDGTTLGEQRELSVSDKKLKLSLADNHDDVADVSVEPGPKGGVKLQLEPVARRPSYAPALVGGGSAMIAGLVWALWLHPAFSDAQDHYNNLGPTADFVSARSDMNTKSMRANVTLGVAITSLGVGLAVEAWELWRVKR